MHKQNMIFKTLTCLSLIFVLIAGLSPDQISAALTIQKPLLSNSVVRAEIAPLKKCRALLEEAHKSILAAGWPREQYNEYWYECNIKAAINYIIVKVELETAMFELRYEDREIVEISNLLSQANIGIVDQTGNIITRNKGFYVSRAKQIFQRLPAILRAVKTLIKSSNKKKAFVDDVAQLASPELGVSANTLIYWLYSFSEEELNDFGTEVDIVTSEELRAFFAEYDGDLGLKPMAANLSERTGKKISAHALHMVLRKYSPLYELWQESLGKGIWQVPIFRSKFLQLNAGTEEEFASLSHWHELYKEAETHVEKARWYYLYSEHDEFTYNKKAVVNFILIKCGLENILSDGSYHKSQEREIRDLLNQADYKLRELYKITVERRSGWYPMRAKSIFKRLPEILKAVKSLAINSKGKKVFISDAAKLSSKKIGVTAKTIVDWLPREFSEEQLNDFGIDEDVISAEDLAEFISSYNGDLGIAAMAKELSKRLSKTIGKSTLSALIKKHPQLREIWHRRLGYPGAEEFRRWLFELKSIDGVRKRMGIPSKFRWVVSEIIFKDGLYDLSRMLYLGNRELGGRLIENYFSIYLTARSIYISEAALNEYISHSSHLTGLINDKSKLPSDPEQIAALFAQPNLRIEDLASKLGISWFSAAAFVRYCQKEGYLEKFERAKSRMPVMGVGQKGERFIEILVRDKTTDDEFDIATLFLDLQPSEIGKRILEMALNGYERSEILNELGPDEPAIKDVEASLRTYFNFEPPVSDKQTNVPDANSTFL